MRRSLWAYLAGVLLAGCSNSGSAVSENLVNMAVENLEAENLVTGNSVANAPAPPPPQHRYAFKDTDNYGDLYGYLGAVSEEDQKKGVATPSVVRFRFTGRWNGAYHLQLISDSGVAVENDECAIPCVVIKATDSSGQVSRVGYSSESIVGAAFDDAMNGQLKTSPKLGTISGGYRFTGGNPNDAANWQRISPPTSVPPQSESDTVQDTNAANIVVTYGH